MRVKNVSEKLSSSLGRVGMLFVLLPIAVAPYLVGKGTEGSIRESTPKVMTLVLTV